MPSSCDHRLDRAMRGEGASRVCGARIMVADNLFADIPADLPDEQIIELLSAPNVRIERIVSTGHATAPDAWYDQDRPEWVLIIQGSAGLIFEGDAEPVRLDRGSYVHIAAHRRHRVAW